MEQRLKRALVRLLEAYVDLKSGFGGNDSVGSHMMKALEEKEGKWSGHNGKNMY
jgi:hypothetical protein